MNALIKIEQHNNDLPQPNSYDNKWVQIFDPYAAVKAVFNHIEKQASSRTTRHTAKQYRICLYLYLEFCGAYIIRDQSDDTRMDGDYFDFSNMHMHTPAQMDEFIVHSIQSGRSSRTINKYLAPIRHYLTALRRQNFLGLTGQIRDLIHDCKDIFQAAAEVDAPPAETKSSESAGQTGVRLNLSQVKEYMRSIDRSTLSGKRDAAIFYVALVSMLRVSEIARIRLSDIRQGSKTPWEIKVMGKRNNVDPVGFDKTGYDLIMEYVEAYNTGLPEDDTRRITRDTPLWQPLRCGSNYISLDETWFNPADGLSADSIREMLKKRTPKVVSEQIGQDGIRPHDIRRTGALGMAEQNVPIPAIQRQLRHSNASTTSNYIGNFTDLSRGLISNYWTIMSE